MTSNSFKTSLFGLVLFSLFSFLMVYTAVQMIDNYGLEVDEVGDGALNYDAFNESVSDVSDKANNYRKRFEKGNIIDVDDVTSLFNIVTDIGKMMITPFKLMAIVLSSLLEVPTVVINIGLGLLGISLILGIWSLIRKGD